ncbi:protein kinase [Chloropicon primus]|uniref:Protein kinase n=1 Tax=Chloropicon primus TaxID=1764295 RepID=A0A5B8MW98_9CHLO|nr:protein kinase [Chloropicon primus]UPR03839.1 protein kinase [Chloropicon primus]|eukprot:QDZ24631.1 protein kinase [Chloropicon primus]
MSDSAIRTGVVHKRKDPRTGVKYLNNYKYLAHLGAGSYGRVKLYEASGRLYAVKVVNKVVLQRKKVTSLDPRPSAPSSLSSASALDVVLHEISVLSSLPRHPNLARLVEVIDDPACDKLYICLEHAGSPALDSLPDSLCSGAREAHLLDVVCQAAAGLALVHGQGVVHGDLKVEHLLVSSSSGRAVVKIVDFGSSFRFDGRDDRVTRSPGTPAYTAPECCTGEPYSGTKADVWALGVAVYRLRYAEFPFQSTSAADIYEEIRSSPKVEVVHPPSGGSELLTAALKRMLTPDPGLRPSAASLLDLLKGLGLSSVEEIEASYVAGVL